MLPPPASCSHGTMKTDQKGLWAASGPLLQRLAPGKVYCREASCGRSDDCNTSHGAAMESATSAIAASKASMPLTKVTSAWANAGRSHMPHAVHALLLAATGWTSSHAPAAMLVHVSGNCNSQQGPLAGFWAAMRRHVTRGTLFEFLPLVVASQKRNALHCASRSPLMCRTDTASPPVCCSGSECLLCSAACSSCGPQGSYAV